MKNFTRFALLCVISALAAGCASFPKTEGEFRAQAVAVNEFVVQQPLAATLEVLRSNAFRCYEMPMSAGSGNKVLAEMHDAQSATLKVQTIIALRTGFSMIVDLESLDESQTRVTARLLSNHKAAQLIEDWFAGGTACHSG